MRNFGYVSELTLWLDDNNIGWRYELVVSVSDITRDRASQARSGDEDKLFVKRYRSLIRAAGGTEKFPPIVLWEDGFNGFRVLDGNHRLRAFREEGIDVVDAIITDAPSEDMAVVISSRPNIEHGKAYRRTRS